MMHEFQVHDVLSIFSHDNFSNHFVLVADAICKQNFILAL